MKDFPTLPPSKMKKLRRGPCAYLKHSYFVKTELMLTYGLSHISSYWYRKRATVAAQEGRE